MPALGIMTLSPHKTHESWTLNLWLLIWYRFKFSLWDSFHLNCTNRLTLENIGSWSVQRWIWFESTGVLWSVSISRTVSPGGLGSSIVVGRGSQIKASALPCCCPDRNWILQSWALRINAHLLIRTDANTGTGLFSPNRYSRCLWSDFMVNCRPCRYCWNLFTLMMIERASLSSCRSA